MNAQDPVWDAEDGFTSEDAVVTTTRDDLVLSWNHGAERLFGFSAHEVLGKDISFLFPDKHRAIDALNVKDAISGTTVRNSVAKALNRAQQVVSIIYTLAPIRDRVGNVVSFLRILKDISAFRRAQIALREAMVQIRRMDSVQDGFLRELAGGSDEAAIENSTGIDIVAAENRRSRGAFLHILADECRMIEALSQRLKDQVKSMVPRENELGRSAS